MCAHCSIVAVALREVLPSLAENVPHWAQVDLPGRFALAGNPLWHCLAVQRNPKKVQCVSLTARGLEERWDGAATATCTVDQDAC